MNESNTKLKHNMKNSFFIFVVFAVVLIAGLSCARNTEIETSASDVAATRSLSEKNTDVDYYYLGSEKFYLNIRRDKVMIRTSSNAEAEKLSKQDIFIHGERVDNMGQWLFASSNTKSVDINSRLKLKASLDVTCGLEFNGLMRYPSNQIFVRCIEGESHENVLAKVGLTDSVEDIELILPHSKVYLL